MDDPESNGLWPEEALKRAAGIDFIAGWNDRQGQTAANVARAMREAAAKLREVVS